VTPPPPTGSPFARGCLFAVLLTLALLVLVIVVAARVAG
jgi:hypothetical protein